MKITKSPNELRKAVYDVTLALTNMQERDRSVFNILHGLRQGQNWLDGEAEARRHGYSSFLTFLTSGMEGQLEVINDSNGMPESFLAVPTENDRSQFDELTEMRKRNEHDYERCRYSRNHVTDTQTRAAVDVPLFENVPRASINRGMAPVAELPVPRNQPSSVDSLRQYVRHRLVVLCWRVQPHALLLDELDSIVRSECPGVVRILQSSFNGNLREFVQSSLPMLTVCKIGLQDHVVWNADYVHEHPTWANDFRLPPQSLNSSPPLTTYFARLCTDNAGDVAIHHTASSSDGVGPHRECQ